jgi:hypothetical protein
MFPQSYEWSMMAFRQPPPIICLRPTLPHGCRLCQQPFGRNGRCPFVVVVVVGGGPILLGEERLQAENWSN